VTLITQKQTQSATQACGTTGLECVLHTNVYNKVVRRASSIHPLATGINTTSLEGTRDWLLANVLKAGDTFSTDLATNMTELVRSNFGINDRVNKAWFIHPGNRWNVPLKGGAQSSLLLTDKLILFAIITLNDGAGNILRRRLLSFSPSTKGVVGSTHAVHEDREMPGTGQGGKVQPAASRSLLQSGRDSYSPSLSDDEIYSDAMRKITMEPRIGTLPPIEYNVDIPLTAATIFGVENRAYSLVKLNVFGKFEYGQDADAMQAVGAEFYRRLSANLDKFCPSCEQIFPVFNDILPYRSSGYQGRRLLQAQGSVDGTYTILLVFDKTLVGTPIFYSDISKAVYSPSYTPVWKGSSDPGSIQALVDSLKSQQFVVKRVEASGTAQ